MTTPLEDALAVLRAGLDEHARECEPTCEAGPINVDFTPAQARAILDALGPRCDFDGCPHGSECVHAKPAENWLSPSEVERRVAEERARVAAFVSGLYPPIPYPSRAYTEAMSTARDIAAEIAKGGPVKPPSFEQIMLAGLCRVEAGNVEDRRVAVAAEREACALMLHAAREKAIAAQDYVHAARLRDLMDAIRARGALVHRDVNSDNPLDNPDLRGKPLVDAVTEAAAKLHRDVKPGNEPACSCGSTVFCPCGSQRHPGWDAAGWGCVECNWKQTAPERKDGQA